MALKLGEKSAKREEEDGQRLVIQRRNEIERARDRLHEDFIQDMADSAIDASMSEEQMVAAAKRYKQLRFKKNMAFWSLVLLIASLLLFGVYNTFLKHELTYEEIAFIANRYNNRTNFPIDGVQGYLTTNMPALVSSKLVASSGVNEIVVENPVLTKISTKSNAIANVYFYITVETNKGSDRVDCMIPLHWSGADWEYTMAGSVIFTPSKSVDGNLEIVENPMFVWSETASKINEADMSKCKTFVDNFFTFLYTGKNVSPYYDGEALDPGNLSYINMIDFAMYNETNQNGYNAKATINVKTSGGMTYTTDKYLLIEKSGNSWIIKGVL
jgi:hypothetical protein